MLKVLLSSFVIASSIVSIAYAVPCKTHRVNYYNTANAKVWSTTICPKQYLPYHTHQTARVVIPQENGELKVLYKSGEVQMVPLKKNTPVLLSRAEGIKLHRDINVGNAPLHVVVVELKHSAVAIKKAN